MQTKVNRIKLLIYGIVNQMIQMCFAKHFVIVIVTHTQSCRTEASCDTGYTYLC